VYVSSEGSVDAVDTIQSIAGADAEITTTWSNQRWTPSEGSALAFAQAG
jgi:hypothetical protein